MFTIMSTEQCQTAYNVEEQSWVIGDDFTEEEGFDMSTVRWSEDAWEDEKIYFKSFLDDQIKHFEKRCRTKVKSVALVGTVGLWDRTVLSGRLLDVQQNPLERMGEVDDIDVNVLADDTIQLVGHHHDGTHVMNLYLLTARQLKELESGKPYLYSGTTFKYMQENFKPLKLTASGREYFNPSPEPVSV